jgi:hypothetical protein
VLKNINAFPAFLLLLTVNAVAQTPRPVLAPGYTRVGTLSSQPDILAAISNPASLTQIKNCSFGIYGERIFGLAGLNHTIFAAGLPTHSASFGLWGNYFGSADYAESGLTLACGKSLGKKIDAGMAFNYNSIRARSYFNTQAISVEAGTILHLSEKWHAGIHVNNPIGGRFKNSQAERIRSVYSVGFGYESPGKFFACADIEKEEDQPATIITGFQYHVIQNLFIRFGISSATSMGWFGIGWTMKSFRLDVVMARHQRLGYSPALLIVADLKKPRG